MVYGRFSFCTGNSQLLRSRRIGEWCCKAELFITDHIRNMAEGTVFIVVCHSLCQQSLPPGGGGLSLREGLLPRGLGLLVCLWQRGSAPKGGVMPPDKTRCSQSAVSMHPTGMHSCEVALFSFYSGRYPHILIGYIF